jgi:hypothetical protein
MPEATEHGFFAMPSSWVGWLSPALVLLAVVQILVRRPFGFTGVFATMIVAGLVALVAVLWKKERSILVWIPLAVGAAAALWTGAELAFPH